MSRQFGFLLFVFVLFSISPVFAEFSEFAFGGNAGNSSAPTKCPGLIHPCDPPRVCAYDKLRTKWYCCESDVSVCWAANQKCVGATNTSSVPSGQQQLCIYQGDAERKWCCMEKPTERCTEDSKRFNLCWSGNKNDIHLLNTTKVNAAFSSLSSASPSASSYKIDLTVLMAMTTEAPMSSYTSTITIGTDTSAGTKPTSSLTVPSSNTDQGGLSSGSKGGIAAGVIGGIAIAGIAGFLLWRRHKNQNLSTQNNSTEQQLAEAPNDGQRAEMPSKQWRAEMQDNRPLYAELEGSQFMRTQRR